MEGKERKEKKNRERNVKKLRKGTNKIHRRKLREGSGLKRGKGKEVRGQGDKEKTQEMKGRQIKVKE